MNNLQLTKRHIQFLAFCDFNGVPSSREEKTALLTNTGISETVMNNLLCSLRKVGVMVKEEKRTIIHPSLKLGSTGNREIYITLIDNGK